jgi:predicted N-acetyltransferase YhbS
MTCVHQNGLLDAGTVRHIRDGRGEMQVLLRHASPADAPTCAQICYEAFATIADRHGFPSDMPSAKEAQELLSSLIGDPRFFGIVAEMGGTVVGSNFLDQRSAIYSVGPVTVAPDAQGHHIGTALTQAVLDEYMVRGAVGVRLVQVSYNTTSFSLYAKLGFDVREPLAALQGPALNLTLPGYTVRLAASEDVQACNDLCLQVHGHDRAGELLDSVTLGAAKVVERHGRVTGYSTGMGLFAHAVAETNDDLVALIGEAETFAGTGFLVPMRNAELLRWCLRQGLRCAHTFNLMSMGFYQEPRGAYLASIGY